MCIEQNGRSLAGGWAPEGRRSGPEATARRGGRDLQGGWLDCRSEFVLFHGNINKLSKCLGLLVNRRIYRLTRTPCMGARPPNHQSIDFQRSDPSQPEDASRKITDRRTPGTARHPTQSPCQIATQLHSKQTFSDSRGCAPIATRVSHKPTCFPLVDRHF